MKNMEEIAYWVQTKRAPCLYKYDNAHKKFNNDAQCSKFKAVELHTASKETPSPKKKKKRKISILDESSSEKKQENVFFDSTAKPQQQTVLSSCKDSIISETELNIKKSSREKNQRNKVQKVNNQKKLQKKCKIISSTPKVASNNKKNHKSIEKTRNLDSSLESGLFSGVTKNKQSTLSKTISKKSADKFAGSNVQNKTDTDDVINIKNDRGDNVVNGTFDDVSDVSGFTANYIRSTKQDPRSRRSQCQRKKISKRLIKESQDNITERSDSKHLVVCISKSVHTKHNPNDTLNCSTDSCNVINLVSMGTDQKEQNGNARLDKSTSQLKFLDPNNKTVDQKKKTSKRGNSKYLNSSFQSKSSVTSRYFTRSKVSSMEDLSIFRLDQSTPNKVSSSLLRDEIEYTNNNSCNRKGLTKCSAKNKGKRKIGNNPDSAVLVIDNSTEQISSTASVNVAEYSRRPSRKSAVKRILLDKSELSTHDVKDKSASSVARKKSGFAACFSDSDDDTPSRKQKFFV